MAMTIQTLVDDLDQANSLNMVRQYQMDPLLRKYRDFSKDLYALYKNELSLWELDEEPDGFEMIDDTNIDLSILSYMRKGKNPDDFLIVVLNMTPVPYEHFPIGVPYWGVYEEVLNSELKLYGGEVPRLEDKLETTPENFKHLPFRLHLSVPSFGALIIKPKQMELVTPKEVLDLKEEMKEVEQKAQAVITREENKVNDSRVYPKHSSKTASSNKTKATKRHI
jgi:1,4-alpha-glucan branching enzyme